MVTSSSLTSFRTLWLIVTSSSMYLYTPTARRITSVIEMLGSQVLMLTLSLVATADSLPKVSVTKTRTLRGMRPMMPVEDGTLGPADLARP